MADERQNSGDQPAIAIASKLPGVGVSIFTTMTRLADEQGALNLSQGFPDFECDAALVAAVRQNMRAGHNQYAPMAGVPELRHALASMIERLYGTRYDPETDITVTAGATEALFCAITALVQPGDEVLLFEPCYDSYVPVVQLCGGVPRFVTLHHPDYRIDWDEAARVFSPRTRCLVINSPHNPAGAVLDAGDLAHLAALVDGSNAVVISDEVYEHVVFDGARHESVSRHAGLRGRSCVISSFGKTCHTTGWKIGYAAAPQALSAEIQRVHQFVTFSVNTPVQLAYADWLGAGGGHQLAAVGKFYQRKRDFFTTLLNGSRFRPLACRGTYFQLLDYSAISNASDVDMALRVLREYGVASIPTSAFYYQAQAPPVLRFCFAKRDETLAEAAGRLRLV
jgi:methionine aminotransferase